MSGLGMSAARYKSLESKSKERYPSSSKNILYQRPLPTKPSLTKIDSLLSLLPKKTPFSAKWVGLDPKSNCGNLSRLFGT